MGTSVRTSDGGEVMLASEVLDDLREQLKGRVLTQDSRGYDEARAIWNAMIDRRPAVIVRCESADDVARAVRFARTHRLVVSVRGGGHNIAGNAVCDDGIMIDLSPMRAVRVDPATRTARTEAGATLADVDKATQAH